MRIIAGSRRGTKLDAVPGLGTRPTADRVKESLFNILQLDVDEDSVVLDIFAGTGALGLEALSRGAKRAVFIENDPAAVAVLKKNIRKCRFEDRAEVLAGDAAVCLQGLAGQTFDLILADPPYRKNLYDSVIFSVTKYHLLSKYGILVTEHAKNVPFSYDGQGLTVYKTKSYGATVLNFFKVTD